MEAGTQVGNYIIKKVLGEGGMARVYLVEHAFLESQHALKVLLPGWLQDEELRLRFIGEGRIQAKLRHPNIVPVTDVVSVPGVAGLVMDFVDGVTLEEFIQQNPEPSVGLVREIFLQILAAMEAAHENRIVHRDIKPSNVLISKAHDGSHLAQVLDFGIAKAFEQQGRRATRTGIRMGTPQYMSPEQVRGAKEVDHLSDIFSLGAVLYEMVSGQEAFDGDSEFDIQLAITQGSYRPLDGLSTELRDAFGEAIARALKVEKGERFQSCGEFAGEVRKAKAGARVEVVRALVERPAKQRPRSEPESIEGMIFIPGGTFLMGSDDGDEDERPVTRVTLSPYYIDRTLVTVAAYREAVEAGACEIPKTQYEDDSFYNWGAPGREQHPINGVTWYQAQAYCEWRGGRLPTEAEWEYAARGSDGRKYPWGNEEPGNRACRWNKGTCPVGSYPAGASPFGLQDMAGNVWEWVNDWYGSYPGGSVVDPQGPASGGSRVLRGGSWGSFVTDWLRAGFRSWYRADVRDDDVGFRCARGAVFG